MRILVTGAAGFIGFHTAMRLVERGDSVVGLDNVNSYYEPALKEARLRVLDEASHRASGDFNLVRADLADRRAIHGFFEENKFDRVIHLAAQAGVRHSIVDPYSYVDSNIVGFLNVLEGCRHSGAAHLTFASTSSVYGANSRMPFSEHDAAVHPLQFYAATKRANELMAHSYSHLYNLATTGLRFFTVYGPWGRPDMALFTFTRKILAGEPIQVFNNGNHMRDFTFVDDIVEGVVRASDDIARPDPAWSSDSPDPSSSKAPFRIFNIGNGSPVKLTEYIAALEAALGRKAQKEMLPIQPGDIPDTWADIEPMEGQLGYRPVVSVREGVERFVEWYLKFYGTKR